MHFGDLITAKQHVIWALTMKMATPNFIGEQDSIMGSAERLNFELIERFTDFSENLSQSRGPNDYC